MNPKVLKDAVTMAAGLEHILIGTANRNKEPHIAAAASLGYVDENHVAASEWFCPTTVSNLYENPAVCLVIWDSTTDTGYQLMGLSEGIENKAILDGWVPKMDETPAIPQIERKILVRVDKIIDFKEAPHNDTEE